ncbi:MAG: D,D-heptose 1,7-bisphosphate phosphatase [Acidobacteriaceae bacterium]|nr:D,D-heptose 1,7-bisphosphate phosphatase [Acidobacteriaceae bacterium]
MKQRALFLDRDGVVNEEVGYLHRTEDVRFVDGVFSLCRTAAGLGYRLVIVTNQAGIARGYYTEEAFQELMAWMREQARKHGVEWDAIYHCPYHPEHGIGHYKQEHEDRKPGIGMLLRGQKAFGLDLTQCVMVGDRCTDIVAANAAGLRQAFLVDGTEDSAACAGSFIPVSGLRDVESWLVEKG